MNVLIVISELLIAAGFFYWVVKDSQRLRKMRKEGLTFEEALEQEDSWEARWIRWWREYREK